MVREMTPLSQRYTAPAGPDFTSRIPVASSSKNRILSKSSSQLQSTKKRAVLGERSENDTAPLASTPATSQSQLKTLKRSLVKSTPRPRPQQPAQVHAPSPASSVTSPGNDTLRTKPGSTPHPSRPSLDMATRAFHFNPDETQLLNMTAPDMPSGLTSPMTSDVSDDEWLPPKTQPKSRKVPARMFTPAPSQELYSHAPSNRLPTPPASQNDTGLARSHGPLAKSTKVHPRPAPTPPRPLNKGLTTETLDPSPNPRRKKTQRVSDNHPKSPSRLDATPRAPAPAASQSRLHGRSSLAARPASQPNPSTPFAAGPSQGTATARAPPATAPPARRQRQSLSKSTTKTPKAKPKTRASLPANVGRKGKGRKSMTPAAIMALTGKPIGFLQDKIGVEPGDDPLLLKALDEDEYWEKKRLSKSLSALSSRSAKKPRASDITRKPTSTIKPPSKLREVSAPVDNSGAPPTPTSMRSTQQPSMEPQTQAESSGFLYEAEHGWASDDTDDEHGDSFAQGGADDTFVHIARQRGASAELTNLSRLAPHTPPRQRTVSPAMSTPKAIEREASVQQTPRPSASVVEDHPQEPERSFSTLHDAFDAAAEEFEPEEIVHAASSPASRAATPSSPARQSPVVESTTPVGSPNVWSTTPIAPPNLLSTTTPNYTPVVRSTTPLESPARAPLINAIPTSPLQRAQVIPRSPLYQAVTAPESAASSPSDEQDTEADITIEGTAKDWEEGDSLDVEPAVDIVVDDEDNTLDADITQEAITHEWDLSIDAAAPLFADDVSADLDSPTSGSPPPADLIDFQRDDSPVVPSPVAISSTLPPVIVEPVEAIVETVTAEPVPAPVEEEDEDLALPEQVVEAQAQSAFDAFINVPTSPKETSLELPVAQVEKSKVHEETQEQDEVEDDASSDHDVTLAPIAIAISPARSLTPPSPPRFDLVFSPSSVSPVKAPVQTLLSPFRLTTSTITSSHAAASPQRLLPAPPSSFSPQEDSRPAVLASPFKSPEVFDFTAQPSSPASSEARSSVAKASSPVKISKSTSPFRFKRLDGSPAPPAFEVIHSPVAAASPARSTHSQHSPAAILRSPIVETADDVDEPAPAIQEDIRLEHEESEHEHESEAIAVIVQQPSSPIVELARVEHSPSEAANEAHDEEENNDESHEGDVTLDALSEDWDEELPVQSLQTPAPAVEEAKSYVRELSPDEDDDVEEPQDMNVREASPVLEDAAQVQEAPPVEAASEVPAHTVEKEQSPDQVKDSEIQDDHREVETSQVDQSVEEPSFNEESSEGVHEQPSLEKEPVVAASELEQSPVEHDLENEHEETSEEPVESTDLSTGLQDNVDSPDYKATRDLPSDKAAEAQESSGQADEEEEEEQEEEEEEEQEKEEEEEEQHEEESGEQEEEALEKHAEAAPSNKILLKLIERGVVKVEEPEPEIYRHDSPVIHAPVRAAPSSFPAPNDLFNSPPVPPPMPPLPVQHGNATPGDDYSLKSELTRRMSTASASDRPFQAATDSQESSGDSSSRPALRHRRSLGDELASAIADGDEEAGNDSFKSVVEVSSMDPRAAARAAAILKLNHAYIEHGVLPSSTPSSSHAPLPTPSTPGTPAGRTPRRHARSRSRQFESQHFATVDSARKLNREELLYEAELEIVASRRSRSRSRAHSMAPSESGWESDETELAVPGGWKYTPVKRKRARSIAGPSMLSQSVEPSYQDKGKGKAVDASRPWGVAEWKSLEKIYKAEKDSWVKERQVKPLPGWIGWAKRALGGAKPEAKEWDAERVVKAFLKAENAEGLGGEWEEKMIALRVKALEKRVDRPRDVSVESKTKGKEEKRFAKKQRVELPPRAPVPETPAKAMDPDSTVVSIVPPSTIRRMLGYVWTRTDDTSTTIEEEGDSIEDGSAMLPPGGIEKKVENKLLTRLKHGLAPESGSPMRQISSIPGVQHPSSPVWTAPAAPRPSHAAVTPFTATASKPVPGLISSSVPPARGLYPKLDPPINQRSTALKALFEPESSSQSITRTSAPIGIPGRAGPRKSVSDLVRSFEEEKVMKNEGALRKVQSRGA